MKRTIRFTLTFAAVCGLLLLVQGCDKGHDHAPAGQSGTEPDAHAALHTTKYNETLVEFPGRMYAMEIIDDEKTGLVTAFLSDAFFNPIEVDTKEVRLNFVVNGQPKTFTLTRIEQETGKAATFTLTDMELATLNCEGWQGDATASVEIGGTPYRAKLVKVGEHDHDGELNH